MAVAAATSSKAGRGATPSAADRAAPSCSVDPAGTSQRGGPAGTCWSAARARTSNRSRTELVARVVVVDATAVEAVDAPRPDEGLEQRHYEADQPGDDQDQADEQLVHVLDVEVNAPAQNRAGDDQEYRSCKCHAPRL